MKISEILCNLKTDGIDNEIIVTFNNNVEYIDEFAFECGMKAKIIDISIKQEYNEITFDFAEFEDYNKNFEDEVWYAPNTNDYVVFSESIYYPKDLKFTQIFDKDVELPFTIETRKKTKSNDLNKLRLSQTPHIYYCNINLKEFDIDNIRKNPPLESCRVYISSDEYGVNVHTYVDGIEYNVIHYLIDGKWNSISKKINDGYSMDLSIETQVYSSIEEAENALIESIKNGVSILEESSPLLDKLMGC